MLIIFVKLIEGKRKGMEVTSLFEILIMRGLQIRGQIGILRSTGNLIPSLCGHALCMYFGLGIPKAIQDTHLRAFPMNRISGNAYNSIGFQRNSEPTSQMASVSLPLFTEVSCFMCLLELMCSGWQRWPEHCKSDGREEVSFCEVHGRIG